MIIHAQMHACTNRQKNEMLLATNYRRRNKHVTTCIENSSVCDYKLQDSRFCKNLEDI